MTHEHMKQLQRVLVSRFKEQEYNNEDKKFDHTDYEMPELLANQHGE